MSDEQSIKTTEQINDVVQELWVNTLDRMTVLLSQHCIGEVFEHIHDIRKRSIAIADATIEAFEKRFIVEITDGKKEKKSPEESVTRRPSRREAGGESGQSSLIVE